MGSEDILLQKNWHATAAKAFTDVNLIFLSSQGLRELWQQPEYAHLIGYGLATAVDELKKTHEKYSFPVKVRLARVLMGLEEIGLLSELDLSNEDLGEFAYCTPVAISYSISEFKEMELLERIGHRFKIVNRESLEKISVG